MKKKTYDDDRPWHALSIRCFWPRAPRYGREEGREGIREAGATRRALFQGFAVEYGATKRDMGVVEKGHGDDSGRKIEIYEI